MRGTAARSIALEVSNTPSFERIHSASATGGNGLLMKKPRAPPFAGLAHGFAQHPARE